MIPNTLPTAYRRGVGLRRSARFVPLMAAVLCIAGGCRGSSAPPDEGGAAPALAPDEKIMLALDYYEPMYKVNADGRVINLRIPWRHLPDPVLADIGKLTELRGLDLGGTTISDDGLVHLKDLQKLRSLSLSATPITDHGLVHLEKLSSLQWVWLSKKTVSKEAVEKLKDARPDMNIYLL